MAKKAILDVLESTIGRYVLGLDAESLNVAVWSGKIELNALQLDVDAVNSELARKAIEAPNLAMPVRVLEGSFDSLKVEVPWTRITSRPVTFRARRLNVLVEPYDHLAGGNDAKSSPTPSKKGGKKKKDQRTQSLAHAEESRLRANAVRKLAMVEGDDESDGGEDDISREGSGSGFGARLARRIVENLQFEVDDVHIALRGCGCSAGIVLGSLSLITTDNDGNKTFVDRSRKSKDVASSFLYKALSIRGLGIYCDEDTSTTPASFASMSRGSQLNHSYILSPLSFNAKLRQSDLIKCVDFPKYLVSSELSSVSIVLSRTQLELANKVALSIAPNKNNPRPLFPEYRPLEPIRSGNAKQWWKYAVRCVGRLNRKRSWPEFFIAFQKRKRYVPLYKRAAYSSSCAWIKPLNALGRTELEAIENDTSISVQGIMFWRNLADAQVNREKIKHDEATLAKQAATPTRKMRSSNARKPVMSSFFGSKRVIDKKLSYEVVHSSTPVERSDSYNDPPIELTDEEMRELEAMNRDQANDTELSADSILCDIKFKLESFKVDLYSYARRPLTSLRMGTVSTSFVANADGSFDSTFSLLSLYINDLVTSGTTFPFLLRSLESSSSLMSDLPSPPSLKHAFDFRLSKSRLGDQDLTLKMVAFEIVASPLLLKEVKDFFTLETDVVGNQKIEDSLDNRNPILQETVGGLDLFYDADSQILQPTTKTTITPSLVDEHTTDISRTAVTVDKLSSAFTEAWKSKNETKRSWTVDLNVHAPILVLPESCTDPNANVLVFDLGRFNFVYGKGKPSTRVVKWFKSRPMLKGEAEFDHCRLGMDNLTFVLGKVGDDDWKKSMGGQSNSGGLQTSLAIIEPISFTLDLGIENAASNGDMPRTCVVGVLPSVSFQISPSQINRMFSVVNKWKEYVETIQGKVEAEGISILDEVREGSVGANSQPVSPSRDSLRTKRDSIKTQSDTVPIDNIQDGKAYEYFHFSVALRRLSANILTDHGDGLEAHLVSVVASSSIMTDGSSSNRLCMGWFWILDKLESNLPRRQRLFAHSNLPISGKSVIHDSSYIMGELKRQGAFSDNFSGSSDLADITLIKKQRKNIDDEVFKEVELEPAPDEAVAIINAKFTSLFINWNPQAVKNLLLMKETMIDFESNTFPVSDSALHSPQSSSRSLMPRPSSITGKSRFSSIREAGEQNTSHRNIHSQSPTSTPPVSSTTIINAKMESLEISLNSAIDDLPIFMLTMARTQVDFHSAKGDDENLLVNLVVGDVRMETPETKQKLNAYNTILGLAPNESKSLLEVKYRKGTAAVRSFTLGGIEKSSCEACAEILLSPMRFVYIQAQALTLVEYVTEGVFGAMAASVASSAAAAIEAAHVDVGEKLFYVKGTAFDLVLPQAAHSAKQFVLSAGNLKVVHRSLADNGGATEHLSLKDVSMKCDQGMEMVACPIRMVVEVKLPPTDVGTEDDRALRVDVFISEASFIVARCHYAQMLATLDENVSETDSFLREYQREDSGTLKSRDTRASITNGFPLPDQTEPAQSEAIKNLSHGGVMLNEVKRRIYMDFKIEKLGLELCGVSTDDPIIFLAAVETDIALQILHDEDKTCADVTLHNLVCEDRRIQSMNRYFKGLISQVDNYGISSNEKYKKQDVFRLLYTKWKATDSTDLDFVIGSPQIVLLPDALTELLKFMKAGSRPKDRTQNQDDNFKVDPEQIEIHCNNDEDGGIEAMVGGMASSSKVKKMNVKLKTSDCRFVFVDMGSASGEGSIRSSSSFKQPSQLTETIVMQGKMEASLEVTSDIISDTKIMTDYQLNGERIEIYTAQGQNLDHPVQILEPAKLALFYTARVTGYTGKEEIDVKFVTLSPIDVTLSIQNAALANTISTSMSDSFKEGLANSASSSEFHTLSDKETSRIMRLASALEKTEDWESSGVESGAMSESEHSIHQYREKENDTTDKIGLHLRAKATSPEIVLRVINDLQGHDDALFTLVARNFVAGGDVDFPSGRNKNNPTSSQQSQTPVFNFHFNTSLFANYFDAHSNLWEPFLLKPWELTFTASRHKHKSSPAKRFFTTFEIESHPCYVSFSEQFLVSLGGASRMWSVYSGATEKAKNLVGKSETKQRASSRKSMAANAARSLVLTMPYGIENHSGMMCAYSLRRCADGVQTEKTFCPSGQTEYFRFGLPKGTGNGGRRLYGQDVKQKKALSLYIGDKVIVFDHVDAEINQPRRAYELDSGRLLFVAVLKSGKATLVHLSSQIDIINCCRVPYHISVHSDGQVHDVGICESTEKSEQQKPAGQIHGSTTTSSFNDESKSHAVFGVPVDILQSFYADSSGYVNERVMILQISPMTGGTTFEKEDSLCGTFSVPPMNELLALATSPSKMTSFEVLCDYLPKRQSKDPSKKHQDAMVAQVTIKVSLVQDCYPFVEFFLQPRAILENRMPINLHVCTPMPNTFSESMHLIKSKDGSKKSLHELEPSDTIEIYTAGNSIAITAKCANNPTGGGVTSWLDGGWIDLPLGYGRRLPEPIRCLFPFKARRSDSTLLNCLGGSEFFVMESQQAVENLSTAFGNKKDIRLAQSSKDNPSVTSHTTNSITTPEDLVRSMWLTVRNFAVDHTGDILFEQAQNKTQQNNKRARKDTALASDSHSVPFSAFSSTFHRRRITLLPSSTVPIHLVQLTMDGDDGVKRSLPFCIENISLCDGGVQSTAIQWQDNKPSEYFAYRKLSASYQSEIHIIPEFVIFNGCTKNKVLIRSSGGEQLMLHAGKMAPVRRHPQQGLIIIVEMIDLDASTAPLQVDDLGLKVCIVKSTSTGAPIGSIAIQTVNGARDSRLVVKIGSIKYSDVAGGQGENGSGRLFSNDYLRVRCRWSELEITLNDTQLTTDKGKKKNTHTIKAPSTHQKQLMEARNKEKFNDAQVMAAQICFHRFTVDFQRIFKDKTTTPVNRAQSMLFHERSQFAMIIHRIRITDCHPDTKSPVVFQSSPKTSFLELCIRTRGPLDADLVKVDLFDLKLAHSDGVSHPIVLDTSEDFIWRMLDIVNRILVSTAELAGVDIELDWNEEKGSFIVNVLEISKKDRDDLDEDGTYRPPRSDTLYDVKTARVSPFKVLVSFKRQPNISRYHLTRNYRGAQLMNYFTTNLKFTVDRAKLSFSGYRGNNVKGPSDHLFQIIKTVYSQQLKMKMFTLMSAVSFQDWKNLTARESGSEDFVDGDILRLTGNLAGRSAGYLLKKVGEGLGDGVSTGLGTIGDGIQDVTELMGVGVVGAGVNSVVSGLGDGVGTTVKGVGKGAGNILRGAGRGVGQIVGGVGGGVVIASKGIGKGVATGDGKAVLTGLGDGVASVGNGIGQGFETAAIGAADGVLAVGQGIFGGVKSIGKGIGDVFTGNTTEKKSSRR